MPSTKKDANKYQEALNHFNERVGYYLSDYLVGKEETEPEKIKNCESLKVLQELVDRATPMKPIFREDASYECPHCHIGECRNYDEDEFGYGGDYVYPKHCAECGGALDWEI